MLSGAKSDAVLTDEFIKRIKLIANLNARRLKLGGNCVRISLGSSVIKVWFWMIRVVRPKRDPWGFVSMKSSDSGV